VDKGLRHYGGASWGGSGISVSILGLVDKGLRLDQPIRDRQILSLVSILGLVDKGLRPKPEYSEVYKIGVSILGLVDKGLRLTVLASR